MTPNNSLTIFQKKIRRIWHNDEWYFSVLDLVEDLTNNPIPEHYWSDLKIKLKKEGFEISDKIVRLKLRASDNKMRLTDCANTENMFRIIQSIPTKKSDAFKRGLARVGYERILEMENPELLQDRAKRYYEMKGYPPGWIENRLYGTEIRQELTGEWEQRGICERKDREILTDEISNATFDVSTHEHKKIKGLDPKFKNQNIRDHMTDLELIFTMLGEVSTTEIAKSRDARGFVENRDAAIDGGSIAGNARRRLEQEIGQSVVSSDNYIEITGKVKKIENNSKPKKLKN